MYKGPLQKGLVAFASIIASEGCGQEFIAQWIAGAIAAGELTAGEAFEFKLDIDNRVLALLQVQGEIWDGLLPGGPMDEESLQMIRALEHLIDPPVDHEGMDSDPKHIEASLALEARQKQNIVLDYPVLISFCPDGTITTYHAPNAVFFLDEHGIQWVKFNPENGYNRGRQHMLRTDSQGFEVVRRG
jgi:hypothetical protein